MRSGFKSRAPPCGGVANPIGHPHRHVSLQEKRHTEAKQKNGSDGSPDEQSGISVSRPERDKQKSHNRYGDGDDRIDRIEYSGHTVYFLT
jgi:hypothetical protein